MECEEEMSEDDLYDGDDDYIDLPAGDIYILEQEEEDDYDFVAETDYEGDY